MRVFTAVRHSKDPSKFFGNLWSENFYPALRELGHEIIESQVDLLPCSRFMQYGKGFTNEELDVRGRVTAQIVDEVRAAHRQRPIDLFLGYFYNSHFDPAAYDELRQLNIPTINFYCNNIHQFELVSAVAAKVDWSWHAERDARASYLAVGARPVWVQMAADPSVYRPVPVPHREPKACFIGQRYADRDLLAAALIDHDVPLDLYGSGWGVAASSPGAQSEPAASHYLGRRVHQPGTIGGYWDAISGTVAAYGVVGGTRQLANRLRYQRASRLVNAKLQPSAKGSVAPSELGTVFSRYELCLSFSNVWADARPGSALIPHVRLRDFEAPMSRVCYLTGHTDEIEAFYEVGTEIDTYRSVEELVDKSRFYLSHPAAAEQLREAGYQRALRDHTWTRRFTDLFRQVGLTG